MDPHPDQEHQGEARAGGRGRVIAAVVIGAIFLVLVVMHLAFGLSSMHSS